MIVVRSSTVVGLPIAQAGRHRADSVRRRLSDRNLVPD